VVIIIEDAHWLDHESLTLVNNLLPRLADWPLLLVLTSRTPDKEATFKTGHVTWLPLSPLPNTALTAIACHALGGRSLDDTLAGWLCQQANGNPLYVEMLCQALQQADAILFDRGTGEVRWTRLAPTLPPSLCELLLARFEELPLNRQDTLKRAAIIGVAFSDAALEQLCQGRLSESEVAAALAEVCQAGLVSRVSEGGYRFQHALMHETIYETLSFAQRQTWHTRLGDWLAQTQPDALELITYHYLRGDDPVKAAQSACQAGDKAREFGIYAGALDYYEQILALPNLPAALLTRAAAGKEAALAWSNQIN
jgi:adenylate cyclase